MNNRFENILPHGLLRIKSQLNSLKPAEKRVAEYILANPDEVIHLTITRLAENAGVSEATIVKFCQRIGYSGYQELKIMLARSGEEEVKEHIYGEIEGGDETDAIIGKIFQKYEQSLRDTKKLLLKGRVDECVKMIQEARRIFFYGFGASGIVARDAELKFTRLNFFARALTDVHSQKTSAALLSDKDLVIAISDSGRTRELLDSLRVVKKSGAGIIVITSGYGSPVAELADVILLNCSKETPFRGSALASRMSQLAVIDVLFLGVATTNYQETLDALKKTRLVMHSSKI